MNALAEIKVWDPLVRLFHWALVAAFFIAYFTQDEWLRWHVIAGYTVTGLLLFRLVWGFVGPRYARFSDFVYPPATALSYTLQALRGEAARYIGHNPAGGAMVMFLLLSLTLTAVSGLLLYGADAWQGPLAGIMQDTSEEWIDILEEIHEFAANFSL